MNQFERNEFIILKDHLWLADQLVAGKAVARCLERIDSLISCETPNLNLLDLQEEAVGIIKEHSCTASFLNYKGFPGSICLSVNNQLVHGIPISRQLQPGDIVKFDLGATHNGVVADAAATAIYGEPKHPSHSELIRVCKQALEKAIAGIQIGKQIGSIGYCIAKTIQNQSNFKIVTNYGGHGICRAQDGTAIPHASPFVPNRSQPDEGIRIQSGMVLAIEPMCCIGAADTTIDSDGWTVWTAGMNAHFEHTVMITEEKNYIVTDWARVIK